MLTRTLFKFTAGIILFGLHSLIAAGQTPSFVMPDTVCINSPVKITNTSTGGTTFYWNFCQADLNQVPAAVNLGNIGGLLSEPVFLDVVSENNNYYGFLVNHIPGSLIRLDFGNSMLNTPTATDLGNFGGIINIANGSEGIQVIRNNGNWYAIIVGGNPAVGTNPKIVQINFGSSIANPAPVATDWGNLGNMLQSVDLYIFNENSKWYGFTVNAVNNTITRFDFGTSFDNPPAAVNMGNPGNLLNYPVGICSINDGGNWHVFIISQINAKLVRLDFGNSLLNTPVPVDLGNPGNTFQTARDLRIIKSCDQIIGFVVDGTANDLIRLDFNNDLLNTPSGVSLGNIGNFDFAHSLSKLFRVGSDLYSFIPNVNNNTLTRVRFAGCDNASLPGSGLKDPPPVSYSQPGTYRVNLVMDDGLPTQTSFCRNIVVLAPPSKLPPADSISCVDTLLLRSRFTTPNLWNDGSQADSLIVKKSGMYWVNTAFYGCTARDSFNCRIVVLPTIKTRQDTTLCAGSPVELKTTVTNADSVRWSPAAGLSDTKVVSPMAIPLVSTDYIITAYHEICTVSAAVYVETKPVPVISVNADTLICLGGTIQFFASGSGNYNYQWIPVRGLSDPLIANPLATPPVSGFYWVRATSVNLCMTLDSVFVKVKPPDRFADSPAMGTICVGDSITLKVHAGYPYSRDSYQWLSPIGNQDPSSPEIIVAPGRTTSYEVMCYDEICNTSEDVSVRVHVLELPAVRVMKSNDIDCMEGEATLYASGGVGYVWTPARTLSDSLNAAPVARVDTTTMYYVWVTGENGCRSKDSISLNVTKNSLTNGYPVANAFTPNGDGHNDCFGIKYWGYIDQLEMSVFNRNGVRVFYSQNRDQCWDGTFNGQKQPAGTYIYIIKALTLCGNVTRRGTVTLIR
jgi:gliding motility-associated-like protein